MNIKKAVAKILAVALALSSLPQNTFALDLSEISLGNSELAAMSLSPGDLSGDVPEETESDYSYTELEDGTIEIKKYNGSGGNVVIPSEIDGKSVTSIGWNAFYDCKSLVSITIPNSVTSIGDGAFRGCTSLASITIPNSVTSISSSAFSGCTSLTAINVATENQNYVSVNGVLYNKDKTSIMRYPAGKKDKNFKIPDGVTEIGWSAFEKCISLTSITIPNSVTSIGDSAFSGCASLTSVSIPSSVTWMEGGVFADCASLKSITIPDSVTSIGAWTFYRCTSLKSITMPDSVTSIGYYAFGDCTSLTSITIPDSVTEIGYCAFESCTSLMAIAVDVENVNYISVNGILYNKDKTTVIYYPEGKKDKDYTIINGVTEIGDYAFNGCANLTSVTIPDSVTSIGNHSFSYCTSLTSVTIPDSVTSIGWYAFGDCTSLTSITIPDSVTSIGNDAFRGCTSLKSITIPNGVTEIGDSAFSGCASLRSITIPDSVTKIDDGAFWGCTNLTNITIPENVMEIGEQAFFDCSELRDVYILNKRNINIAYNAFGQVWWDDSPLSIHGYAGTAVEKYAKENGINFISLGRYYEIPPVPSRTSYYLKVTDEDGNVINDAKVTDGNKQFTGSNGIFKLDGVSGSKVTVSSDKFRDTDVSLSRLSSSGVNNVSSSDDVSLSAIYYSKDSSVDSAFESGTIGELISKGQAAEVLSNATTIELKQTKWSRTEYYDFYLYCAGDTDDISSYSVVCGSKTLCSSSTPKLKLNTSMLAEGEALTLECKNSDGKSKTYKINLKIADNTRSSLSRELSINSASVNLPDELSWLGSVNLSLPTIPVYAKVSGDEVRVGVGVNKDVLETYDGFDGFKKAYNKFKTDYSKSNKYFAADSLAELKKTYLENSNKSELPGIGSVDISVVGCGYAKFDGNGITSVDFDLIITAEAKAEFSSQFFVTVVPVTVKIEAGVKVEGDFQATLTGIATDNFNFTGNIELEITPFVKPYAGIGIDNVANVGVFGQVELPVKICLLNTDASKVGLKSIDLRGKAGLQANVLFFSYDLTLFEGSINLYTRPESLMSSTIAQREAVMSCVKHGNAVQAAQNIANYSAVSNTTEYTVTDSNEGLIANNVSPLSSSDVLVTDDMTILASVNSDLSRGTNNQTYISTAVFKDGKWSEIKAVNDSSLAEFAPKLYKSGDDIFLIYQQALKSFDDSAESSEITKNIGIAVSKFNPETLTFENTNTVYSTAGYSTEPKTYDGYSVWLTNSEGDPFGKSDNNSIIVYDGSSATTLADNISNAVSVDIGKLSGDTYIAYLTDGDGDLSTADDIRLYAVSKNGGTPVQVDEGAIESFEFAKVGDGKLVWNKEGKLYTIDSENASACDTGVCINGDFGILDDGTLYYTGGTSEQSAVYLMKAGENTWENPYEYFTCNGNINKTYSDGQSILIDAADSADPDCAHRLYLTKSVECKDIIVEAVSFDPGYIVSGSQIPLTLALTNNGSETVQTAAFRITDEEMNTISVYTLDNLDIKPGSTTECTILVKPEDNCLNKKVYVTVIEPTDSSELSDSALDADLEKDRTVKNNKYLLDFTKSDLEVKIEEYLLGKNNSLIFTVMNNTDVATGGTLSITDSDGNELLSKHYDDITFNNSQIAELKVSELISKGKAGDVITATVTADNDDYNEYNNTAGHSIKLKLDEAIDSFTASDIGKTQLTLNWSGLTKKCGVVVEQLVGDEWEEIAILNDGSVGKYTVSGLTETTSYSFRIRAFENFGSETGYGEYQLLETSTCHNFGEWVTVTERTCTEDGEESRTCEVCGETETRRTTATGHDYSDKWTVDVEAACNDGSKSHHCTRCDAKTDITVIPGKGHTVVIDAAVVPSCTEPGLTEGSHCSVCNTVIKAQETVPATGHDFENGICKNCNKTEAETIQSKHPYDNDCDQTWTIHRDGAVRIDVTFTEDTYTESNYDYIYIYDGDDELIGSYSGDELSGKTITVNSDTVKIRLTSDSSNTEYGFALDKIEYSTEALCDHSNTEIRNAVSAGCTTEGYTGDTYCVDCDELISSGEVIPAKGHTEVIDKAVAATCTKTGLTEGKHCAVCNAVIKAQTVVPAKGHTEVIDKAVAATCTKTGLTEGKHCAVCYTVIKAQTVVPAKGHTEVTDKAVAATCTTIGLTEGKHCSVCNAVIKAQTVVPAKGHTEVTDKAVAATCTKTGLTEGKHCSVCGTVIKAQTVVPAKGHTEVIDKAVEATCTKTGLTEGKHCSVCGTVIKAQEVVPATGKHSFGKWKITKAATCTAEGTQTRTCSVCGKVETQTIAKVAHKYVDTVVKPTYTAQGYTLHKCSVCGTSYKDTYTAKLTLAQVTGVKLGGRAADALRVNWNKDVNASGYIVEMYQGNKWVRVAKITSNATTTYRASGLKASTVYKFRVRAYKMEGKAVAYGAYSTELAARTNPSVMTGAKLSGRAADALRINWTKNASADGYIVEMYQGNKWVRVAKITSNSTTTFRKAGLKASSVYKFRVRAYKMSGSTALYGNYSAVVTARTNPSIVKGVKIGGKAKDALRVNWTKNSSAQGYIVEMYQGNKWVRVAKITNGNTTTYRKAGLAKNTTYKFRVCAYYMSGKTALYGNYGSVSGKTAAK